jgi:Metal-dependent hydrolases of the beta-lactamase superfamily III
MQRRRWLALSGMALGAVGAGIVLNSFLPRSLILGEGSERATESLEQGTFPEIEVTFLQCGSVQLPEFLAVRGAFSARPRTVAYSAVLIKHPQATFLYDTGLCTDIDLFLMDQSCLFRQTQGHFAFEQSVGNQLQRHGLQPADLDCIVLSHLHWDHVAGIPDLPGVPLRINRVEYEVASQGLFERNQGLVRRLLSNNPVQLVDFTGGPYAGFRSSHDLFGDGSIILVPLPGHTAGQMGMFINRANGTRLFLLGDAAWLADNYRRPAPMHPVIWSQVTSNDDIAQQTLVDLYYFSRQHPEVAMIGMHDAQAQDAFTESEQSQYAARMQEK